MPEFLEGLKARMKAVRRQLRHNRSQIIGEALDLFRVGLDADEVYVELRERYLESIPAIAAAADAAVDWQDVLKGPPGSILEAIDGKVVDALLRLIVQAADRRRARIGVVTVGDLMRKAPLKESGVVDITPAPEPEDAPSRSGALAGSWNDGMDGPI